MSLLFQPLTLRQLTLPNRVVVSPMCQYSSEDGFANDWHLVHLGSPATGGAGLVIFEATAVTPDGRITPQDLGLGKDEQIEPLRRITQFIEGQGSVAGIQLAHAGRKASTWQPWLGKHGSVPIAEGGWVPVAPSANRREDDYGGNFENRIRLLLEVTADVRAVWPEELPLFVRVSATDWVEDGWDVDETVELARRLKTLGVDLIDVSSGGTAAQADIPTGPGYQTQFAERVRKEAGIPSGAVGMITDAAQAEHVLRTGQADLVLLARELLRDPYWPLNAAEALREKVSWPPQYVRAAHRDTPLRKPFGVE